MPDTVSPAESLHGSENEGEVRTRGRLADAPWRVRLYLSGACVAALVLPFVMPALPAPEPGSRLTVLALVAISVLNVELSRALSGGLERTHQPHKALSAWALACALLLPAPWLLVVVPFTYAHARWRGLRVPLWKWVASGTFLVLAGLAAALVRHELHRDEPNWMDGDGFVGLLVILLAAVVFLATESALFAGSAYLNSAEDETWLRRTLASPTYYGTELGVLLIGGLLSAVWTGGAWYVLLFVPVYALAQRAVLHEPLRERAEMASQLAAKNHELEAANRFKVDLMRVLAHEIGNPLTPIQGYAEVGAEAAEVGDTARVRSAFEVIERNALQVRRVLLEIGALVADGPGAFTATPEVCRLKPHLEAAVSAQPPGLQPGITCPDGLSAMIQPSHLDQILANLLSNAAKYAGGAIHVVARQHGEGAVEVSVIDAGPGVPDDLRDQLFERFSRGAATATQVIGTGMGLFISRELAQANGGDIRYEEGEPTGSRFVITLREAASGKRA